MLTFSRLIIYFETISKIIENWYLAQVRQQYKYTKCQWKIPIVFRYVLNFPCVPILVVNFTVEMIGHKTEHLLKCVPRASQKINQS